MYVIRTGAEHRVVGVGILAPAEVLPRECFRITVVPADYVRRGRSVERELRGRESPQRGVREAQWVDRNVGDGVLPVDGNLVIERAVIETECDLLLELPPTRQVIGPADRAYRAAARHVEEPTDGAGIDVGITGDEIERA